MNLNMYAYLTNLDKDTTPINEPKPIDLLKLNNKIYFNLT